MVINGTEEALATRSGGLVQELFWLQEMPDVGGICWVLLAEEARSIVKEESAMDFGFSAPLILFDTPSLTVRPSKVTETQ